MGYAGGAAPNPTYTAMGDHAESFQVDFDPDVISYDDLLELFWTSHDPTHQPWKVQYASLVLAGDETQLAAAKASGERMSDLLGRPLTTRIERLQTFWLAEEYHQKYHLRGDRDLMAEFSAYYPSGDALRESTAAARVNGYLTGDASCIRLAEELPELGLSEGGAARLRGLCGRRGA